MKIECLMTSWTMDTKKAGSKNAWNLPSLKINLTIQMSVYG